MTNQIRTGCRSLAGREPPLNTSISDNTLDQLFCEARTHSAWLPDPVPVELLRMVYELARLGPTSANGSPARYVFLTTPGAKARLQLALAPGNVEKTMTAPVTVIIAWDTEFYENLPRLFPQHDMRSYFIGNKSLIEETTLRNSSLQAHILSWPLALWAWTADQCRVLMPANSMLNFLLTAGGKSTFYAISAMETTASCFHATRA